MPGQDIISLGQDIIQDIIMDKILSASAIVPHHILSHKYLDNVYNNGYHTHVLRSIECQSNYRWTEDPCRQTPDPETKSFYSFNVFFSFWDEPLSSRDIWGDGDVAAQRCFRCYLPRPAPRPPEITMMLTTQMVMLRMLMLSSCFVILVFFILWRLVCLDCPSGHCPVHLSFYF